MCLCVSKKAIWGIADFKFNILNFSVYYVSMCFKKTPYKELLYSIFSPIYLVFYNPNDL